MILVLHKKVKSEFCMVTQWRVNLKKISNKKKKEETMDNHFNLNLDLISNELRLLLEILALENDDSICGEISELATNIDWGLFLELAMHHRVYPLIYLKLKRLDEKLIPRQVVETLSQTYKRNTFQMLQLSAEMEQVSKLFTENQIRLLYLKGPVIAFDLYGDISLRTSKDLDILISITDLERAEELLLNVGYEREEKDTAALHVWKWREHHVSYFHPGKGIQLEVHWRLHPPPMKEPSFDELWERRRKSVLTTHPVYFFGEEDLFLYLIIHGARHGWFRLRWLIDIDQMVRKGLKFEKVSLLFRKYHCNHVGGQALILASQLLNTPINHELHIFTIKRRSRKLAQMVIYFIKEIVSLQEIMSTNHYKRYLYSLRSNTQKFYSIVMLLYPNSRDVETLRLPKPFHFLYFPLRPFLWAWRKTRKYA